MSPTRGMKAEETRGISICASGVLSQANDVDLIERRRAQIVEAAVSLFARQGFYRTTVQEIARKANVSAGLIYHYARTKEEDVYKRQGRRSGRRRCAPSACSRAAPACP